MTHATETETTFAVERVIISDGKLAGERTELKLGVVGTGNVGCAIALAAMTRGSAREIVLVNRTRKTAEAIATDLRYGTPLGP